MIFYFFLETGQTCEFAEQTSFFLSCSHSTYLFGFHPQPVHNFRRPEENPLNEAHSIFFIRRLVNKDLHFKKKHYKRFTITKIELDIFCLEKALE